MHLLTRVDAKSRAAHVRVIVAHHVATVLCMVPIRARATPPLHIGLYSLASLAHGARSIALGVNVIDTSIFILGTIKEVAVLVAVAVAGRILWA